MPDNPTPAPTPPTPEPGTPPAPLEPPAPAAPPAPTEGQGNDDNSAHAAQRIQAERDLLKQQLADAQAKLADVKTAEDLEAAKQAALDEAKAIYDAKMLDLGIEVALVKAGCVNTKATMALIDRAGIELSGDEVKGLDVAKLATDYPYLFQAQPQPRVSTGAQPAGKPTDDAEFEAMRKAAGLKGKKD